jgi:antitoxin SocA-like protein
VPEEGEFEFSQRRFKDLLLYVSAKLGGDPTFGETKLNKVLFFSDFEAFRLRGRSITGAEYQKNKYGPTARLYTVMRDELIRWDQLRVERRLVVDHVQDVPRPHNIDPNLEQFDEEEVALVDRFIEEMRRYTNKQVSDLSHERSAGWNAVEMGETIPYASAFISTEPLTEREMDRALQRSRDEGWASIRP